MLNKNKLGLVVGSFLGIWHLAWTLLVAVGIAQWLMDWVFRLHFIQPPYKVTEFRPILALALIVLTSILGYFIGWVLAVIWNWLHAEI
jgi:hypothetical protein